MLNLVIKQLPYIRRTNLVSCSAVSNLLCWLKIMLLPSEFPLLPDDSRDLVNCLVGNTYLSLLCWCSCLVVKNVYLKIFTWIFKIFSLVHAIAPYLACFLKTKNQGASVLYITNIPFYEFGPQAVFALIACRCHSL